VDLNSRIAELKAKRRAVEQAIAALQHLKAEYRDRKGPHRLISPRRASSEKTTPTRKIA
jgi:hypothetical protein